MACFLNLSLSVQRLKAWQQKAAKYMKQLPNTHHHFTVERRGNCITADGQMGLPKKGNKARVGNSFLKENKP